MLLIKQVQKKEIIAFGDDIFIFFTSLGNLCSIQIIAQRNTNNLNIYLNRLTYKTIMQNHTHSNMHLDLATSSNTIAILLHH